MKAKWILWAVLGGVLLGIVLILSLRPHPAESQALGSRGEAGAGEGDPRSRLPRSEAEALQERSVRRPVLGSLDVTVRFVAASPPPGDLRFDVEVRSDVEGESKGTRPKQLPANVPHRFSDLPWGAYIVQASALGWVCLPQGVSLSPERPQAALELHAQPAGILRGRVFQPDGDPARDAQVSAAIGTADGLLDSGIEVKTDSQGAFSIPLAEIEGTQVQILARSSHFGPDLAIFQTPPREAVELHLQPGIEVFGVVVSGGGGPVPKAQVFVKPTFGALPAWHRFDSLDERATQTDAVGAFRLSGVVPGQGLLRVTAEGFSDFLKAVEFLRNPAERLEIVLIPEVAASGVVRSPSGSPIAGAEVYLEPTPKQPFRAKKASSDEGGGFRFSRVSPGSYSVAAVAPGYAPKKFDVELPSPSQIEMVLEQAGAIVGEVRQEGEFKDYWVQVYGASGQRLFGAGFSESGFRIAEVSPGRYEVRLRVEGQPEFSLGSVQVFAGTVADLGTIVPALGSSLSGQVVLAETRRPVGATCTLLSLHPSSITRPTDVAATMEAQDDGWFRFRGLRGGLYRLLVHPREGAAVQVPELPLDGTGFVDLGEILVPRGGRVEVEVLDVDGKALSGASLTLSGANASAGGGKTDPQGRAVFEEVGPGRVSVSAQLEGWVRSESCDVEAGKTAHVRIHFGRLPSVEWKARLATLPPQGKKASLIVSSLDRSWRSAMAAVEADGTFRIKGMSYGAAFVDVYGFTAYPDPIHILMEFPAQGGFPQVLPLPSGGITGGTNPPLPNVSVIVGRKDWLDEEPGSYRRYLSTRFASAMTDARGQFVVPFLPDGTYAVTAFPEGGLVDGTVQAGDAAVEDGAFVHRELVGPEKH